MDSQNVSHQGLVKAFKNSIEDMLTSVDIKTEVETYEGFRPDIILNLNGEKVLVELKKASHSASVIRSIYQILGYLNLTSEKYDFILIVIPMDFFHVKQVENILLKINEKYEKIGIMGYSISDNNVSFEQIINKISILPSIFYSKLDEPYYQKRKSVSIVTPKSLQILKFILENNKTTQLEISSQTNVSLGQVNKVVSYLRERNIAEYKGKYLTLIDSWKLLNDISWHRRMDELKVTEFYISKNYDNIEEVENKITSLFKNKGIKYAFTLFSAAKKYSPYIKKYDVMQIYLDDLKIINQNDFQQFIQKNKGALYIEIYQADSKELFTESIKINGRNVCSKIQTVIDLVCYGPSGKEAAIDIYSKMRGNQI
ncbi:MAG: winged helix-turn-helix transcriptional regulator [Candidatus Helarchaeota archaeon]|nr:winged helix-turn-helix transcriptional regulator [Candidatus Helarchaeota archaeon]